MLFNFVAHNPQDLRHGPHPSDHLLHRLLLLRLRPAHFPKSPKDAGLVQHHRLCRLYRLALYATEVIAQGRVPLRGYAAYRQGC